jgi:molybdate transport system regulatory protein
MTARDPQHDRSGDPRLRLRILFGPDAMMGPGKADLLEHIGKTGSIAAAGRAMGMSYKRAWQLVEVMNAIFTRPLVESSRGGPAGGGAVLTEEGARVLSLYRALEARVAQAGSAELAELAGLLRDMSHGK